MSNLLFFFKEVYDVVDNKRSVDVIYLDFQKAFDTVPHNKLLNKLFGIGIRGKILGWMKSWLSDRKQRVVINGKSSCWKPVTSGVPQGSVLGPVLFIVYINDLDDGLCCKISKFADDTKLGHSVNTQESRLQLQHAIDKVTQWSDKWQMSFNLDKCKVMHLGHDNQKHIYTMAGQRLKKYERVRPMCHNNR